MIRRCEQGFGTRQAGPVVRFHVLTRYLTFEYLLRTAANLALTVSRHNTGTRPDRGRGFGLSASG
jgi:hypothetical protein